METVTIPSEPVKVVTSVWKAVVNVPVHEVVVVEVTVVALDGMVVAVGTVVTEDDREVSVEVIEVVGVDTEVFVDGGEVVEVVTVVSVVFVDGAEVVEVVTVVSVVFVDGAEVVEVVTVVFVEGAGVVEVVSVVYVVLVEGAEVVEVVTVVSVVFVDRAEVVEVVTVVSFGVSTWYRVDTVSIPSEPVNVVTSVWYVVVKVPVQGTVVVDTALTVGVKT
ncbi:MAG: hypothetical protein ABF767_08845 [Lentilactobacillus hilgardii]